MENKKKMKTLKETNRYQIDSTGQIYNRKSGNKMTMKKLIHLDIGCKRTKVIVANNLLENPNNYKNIVNIDGNINNNFVSNLMWAETVYGNTIISKKDDVIIRSKLSVLLPKCYDNEHRDYMSYGAKGITIYEPWRNDTLEFVKWSKNNEYYRGAWLIRYDKSMGYNPDNCFWGEPDQCFKLNCEMVMDIAEKVKTIPCNTIANKYQVTGERIRQIKRGATLKNCK